MSANDSPLPCGDCGLLTIDTAPSELVITHYSGPGGGVFEHGHPQSIAIGLCSPDLAKRALATAVVQARPNLRAPLGGALYVAGLLADAWTVLEALGLPVNGAEAEAMTDAELRLQIDTLADLGALTKWSSRVAPIDYGDRPPSLTKRFAYVDKAARSVLAQAYALMLKRRIEGPEMCPPPSGLRGCLACGVGGILVKPSLAARAWGPERPIRPGDVGGEPGAELSGHFCAKCSRWVPQLGLGEIVRQSHIEAALKAYLGAEGSMLGIDGVVAWGAIPGAKSNAEPWEHLANLAEIRDALRPTGGLRGWADTNMR